MSRQIVTLCGSTRFYSAFQRANFEETMAGRIVLTVGFYPHAEQAWGDKEHGETIGVTPEQKRDLDRLHFKKIRMSDGILVLNVGGYVGDSTRNEIALAVALGKGIRWLDEERGGEAWLEANAHDLGKRIAKLLEEGELTAPSANLAEQLAAEGFAAPRSLGVYAVAFAVRRIAPLLADAPIERFEIRIELREPNRMALLNAIATGLVQLAVCLPEEG